MKLEAPAAYFADVENRRALGYFRLLSKVIGGRDPHPLREDDEAQEVMVMEVPARLRPANLRQAAVGCSQR